MNKKGYLKLKINAIQICVFAFQTINKFLLKSHKLVLLIL